MHTRYVNFAFKIVCCKPHLTAAFFLFLSFQVDNYEPKEFQFNIKASADAQFNNIQYMYIGRNETMTEGFIGCISRVEFDDIYPLKLLFQENGPANVRSLGKRKS